MAKDVSFDICSTVDMQEVDNAVNQTNKEIGQRYDFKNSKAKVTMEDDGLKIIADDDFKLRSVVEILKTKLVNRKIPVKNLDYGKVENASGGTLRQMVKIQNGIDQDKARAIVKDIKGMGLKVQSQIMEAQVRVSGKNRDDMQAVIQMLRTKDYGIELQFGNYR
ncbi:MAG: YajQ family cyclic di-GMP-binding protein [Bacteroidota bacterium]